jgi:hypothetical protein
MKNASHARQPGARGSKSSRAELPFSAVARATTTCYRFSSRKSEIRKSLKRLKTSNIEIPNRKENAVFLSAFQSLPEAIERL